MRLQPLHLAGLSALCVAQPLYQVVARAPAFLTADGDAVANVVGLCLLLSAALPALCIVADGCATAIGGRSSRVRAGAIGAVVALGTSPAWPHTHPLAAAVGATLTGAAVAVLYRRFDAVRACCSVLIVSLLAVPALFLSSPTIAPLWLPARRPIIGAVANPIPVVLIVFDELSLPSLMTPGAAIDRERYPGFGELAATSTWYRNASSVVDDTTYAVPAIVTGLRPSGVRAPTAANYSQSLFTVLGETHDFHVVENYTSLCPSPSCAPKATPFWRRHVRRATDLALILAHVVTPPAWADRLLPPLAGRWHDFATTSTRGAEDHGVDRETQVSEFLTSCGSGSAPPLCYLHVALPHVPLEYLPSGHRYSSFDEWWLPDGVTDQTWVDEEWPVIQGWQRHLLQTGYTDRVLARILHGLKARGLFDRALVVVVADHGVSFRPGRRLRWLDRDNLLDIASVPLFVKRPGQSIGQISDRNVETIDVLPTVADVLGIDLVSRTDGQSVFDRVERNYKGFSSDAGAIRVALPAGLPDFRPILDRQRTLFGTGQPIDQLFRVGPRPDTIGRQVTRTFPSVEGIVASVEGVSERPRVDRDSDYRPSRVVGRLSGPGAAAGMALVVAINGVVRATTSSVRVRDAIRFSAMVPEEAFIDGINVVDILTPDAVGDGLRRVATDRTSRYELITIGGRRVLADAERQPVPVATSARGNLERAIALYGALSVRGWAIDDASGRPVRSLAVFDGLTPLYVGQPDMPRPDLMPPATGAPGFEVTVATPGGRTAADIRVFAVTDEGGAFELPRHPWFAFAGPAEARALSGPDGNLELACRDLQGVYSARRAGVASVHLEGTVDDSATAPRPVRLIVFAGERFILQTELAAPRPERQPFTWSVRRPARRAFAVEVPLASGDEIVDLRVLVAGDAACRLSPR